MKRILPLVVLLVISLSLGCAHRRAARSNKTFFPLGVWYEGGVGKARDNVLPEDPMVAAVTYDENFADIAAHGINVITVPNSPPDHHKTLLDSAHKHGLKVILELGLDGGPFGYMIRGKQPMDPALVEATIESALKPIKHHPALLRVQLLDEPPEDAFARYAQVAAAVQQASPGTPAFCCLVGMANGEAFLQATKSDVVAFDFYPLGEGAKAPVEELLGDFAKYAQKFSDWAAAAYADSWAVIQCHELTGGLRFPTEAEVRCMTYSALATGNRGVFWFLYQTQRLNKETVMSGLVDREFKGRPLWEEVRRLAKEIKPLTPVLAELRPDHQTTIESTGHAFPLRDHKGKLYVWVVNFDTVNDQRVETKLPFGKTAKRLGGSNGWSNIYKARGKAPLTWRETLPPGGGALYRIK